jgi:hypothetical protein
MSSSSTKGLIEYVNYIKPYHTKILEVNNIYQCGDVCNGSLNDALKIDGNLLLTREIESPTGDSIIQGMMSESIEFIKD